MGCARRDKLTASLFLSLSWLSAAGWPCAKRAESCSTAASNALMTADKQSVSMMPLAGGIERV